MWMIIIYVNDHSKLWMSTAITLVITPSSDENAHWKRQARWPNDMLVLLTLACWLLNDSSLSPIEITLHGQY